MTYLDHNATSPLRPEARAAMAHALEIGGNPSSVHANGRAARAIVEDARERVAALVGARAQDVVFTSGGTEANVAALCGAVQGAAEGGARITRLFVSAIEHVSVRDAAAALAERVPGLRLDVLTVTADGVLDVQAAATQLREGKGRALIAVMFANNETGIVQPLADVARLARENATLLLVDAIQAAGKIDVEFDSIGADYLVLSAHKIGGPQGVGALVLREGTPFASSITGGGQELGRRGGTENVAGIAGFGAAAVVALGAARSGEALRSDFERRLQLLATDCIVFGAKAPRLANTSNFALPGLPAETALMALDLDGVMVSSGAACSSGKVKPSHVLAAMGVPEEIARCALRVSFGWNSSDADVEAIITSLAKLRARVAALKAA